MTDPQTRVERPAALPGAAIRRVAAGPVADGSGCAAAIGPTTCPHCGGHRDAPGLDTCWLCFHRDQATHARAAYADQAAARREDYTWLRDDQRLSITQAAERLGVTYRTAQRYEALRRQASAA